MKSLAGVRASRHAVQRFRQRVRLRNYTDDEIAGILERLAIKAHELIAPQKRENTLDLVVVYEDQVFVLIVAPNSGRPIIVSVITEEQARRSRLR